MATTQRPFRFGVQVRTATDAAAWADLARRAEALGIDVLTMPDHFDDQLAPIPALQAAADATTTLRVGALVHDNDYKHPVVLAKELATIDVLSGGRLEIGLGAGWMESDYRQSGISYDRPGVRVDRFVEGLAVIKGAMADGAFSFAGEHYTITEYDGTPTPLQRPHPPVLIGGGGPRVLRFAAREADIVGINATLTSGAIDASTFASMSAEAVDAKVAIVREAGAHRLHTIEMNIRTFLVNVTDDADSALAEVAAFTGEDVAMVANSPFALIGPPPKLIEDLQARRERWGFSYIIIGADDLESMAPVVAALRGT
jgi:probable F420-dependent oxidoreductase